MRMRRACQRKGHKWSSFPPLPFQFCDRWFCDGERVNPGYPMSEGARKLLQAVVDEQQDERERR